MNYPNIEDPNFYERINEIYKPYKTPKKRKSFEEICFPKEFNLQLPQLFVSNFINPQTPYKGLLVYHSIGSGKTITAIQVAEKWKNYKNIIVLVPASLKGNFRGELRSQATGNEYINEEERKKISKLHPTDKEYINIIKKSDERIDKYYKIYSYNKFIELVENDKINLKNTLLIIDEIQNMVSEGGNYYNVLYEKIKTAPSDLRIILLSATPMFDKPHEIGLTMNLLRIPNEMPIGREFNRTFIQITKTNTGSNNYKMKNIKYFKELIKGYVSYFRGAPPYVFPKMTIKYIKCEMSDFQYKAYTEVIKNEVNNDDTTTNKEELSVGDLPNNFFIGTRMVSNIVFPNKKINEEGFESFKGKHITEKLDKYSIKFSKIISKINKAQKIFIYSSFKKYGGIKSMVRVLEEIGYKNYSKYGEGTKRFAIWSGDENTKKKDEIKAVFNKKENLNGSKIKIILGSPSIKEGVSFTGVRQVHVLEPYWNLSRMAQVVGRASRFCSHKDLPEEKRDVKVYIYVATYKDIKTVDQYINHLSKQKNKLIKEFDNAIKEAAIDCELNKFANVYDVNDNINCDI